MSKREQLMELVTQDIIACLVQDRGIEWDAAMGMFYQSAVFEKLWDESTGLYRESTGYVYDLFLNELQNGRLVQEEE